jgi:predicted ATPase/DNA-binding winged helix-turn-helix (wHTH) protein
MILKASFTKIVRKTNNQLFLFNVTETDFGRAMLPPPNARPGDGRDPGTLRARSFGPFRLSLAEQVLFEGDRRLPLKGRAFEILMALTERPGELISKNDLLAKVWPDVHVDEAALRVHISALRKVLGPSPSGAQYIANVAGRGYKFVGQLVESLDVLSGAFSPASEALGGFQRSEDRIIGREMVVQTLVENLPTRRFVTITGPGGMGKTAVALAVAAKISNQYRDGVHFVDLSSLSDASLVLQKVTSALKLQGLSFHSEADLVSSVQDRWMLLILDNCEHLVEPIALLAERFLEAASAVHILTTSREPLRAAGEWVHRLPPLELPPLASALNTAEVLNSPSAVLFLKRVRAANDTFVLADADIESLVDICHRVDGIPLAIELAAARVDLLGIQVLAKLLHESFNVLTEGRRTALPRHRTLRATLDWSYELLAEDERILLRKLAVFCGYFTLEAAAAVAEDQDSTSSLLDGIAALVAKSLISAAPAPHAARYRLLETTRVYALEKLAESGERDTVLHRHADYFYLLLDRAEADWAEKPEQEWLAIYAHTIADVRAAIDWLLKQDGHRVQGIALTGLSSVLWFALGAMEEYRGLAKRALGVMHSCAPDHPEAEMRLNTWLAAATFNTLGPAPQMAAGYTRAVKLAAELNMPEYQLYALWGLAAYHNVSGDYDENLSVCRRLSEVAEEFNAVASRLVRDRIMASALCFVGQLAKAREYGERALQTPPIPSRSINKRFHEFDHHLASRLHLPRILWLQGFSDRAALLVREGVEKALSPQYSPSLCCLLAFAACPIALWSGDSLAADRYLHMLANQTANRSENYWRTWWNCFTATTELGVDDGSNAFQHTRDAAAAQISGPVLSEMAATVREELVGPMALSRASSGRAPWCAPEILRAHAVTILKTGGTEGLTRAEEILGRSLTMAREQGALAWQLRTAVTLAGLYQSADRHREARSVLAPIYDAFSEGFGTEGLRTAAGLLASL